MFYNEFLKIIGNCLKSRKTINNLIEELIEISKQCKGKIAFFPCGRLTAEILKEIKIKAPELVPKIIGCFDNSYSATTESGFKTFHFNKLNNLEKDISILIVASNTYYSREMNKLMCLNTSNLTILNISYFDTSFPPKMQDNEILKQIDYVYKLLSDQKSKMCYMIAWLSRLLNDDTLTDVFGTEQKLITDEEPIKYKKYTIHGIDRECKKELLAELYKMKHVSPEKGDVVFDIGAYMGDTSVFFAHYVKENGRVYAFEPIEPNYKMLKKNIEINSLSNIVQPQNMGISKIVGNLKGVTSGEGGPWSFLGEDRGNIDVKVTTIDSFIALNNIYKVDYIKMDVEGLEEDVIEGAKETIQKYAPKLAVAIYHNTSDLITLPIELDKITKYNFYLRSKIDGPFGFTLYAKKS